MKRCKVNLDKVKPNLKDGEHDEQKLSGWSKANFYPPLFVGCVRGTQTIGGSTQGSRETNVDVYIFSVPGNHASHPVHNTAFPGGPWAYFRGH